MLAFALLLKRSPGYLLGLAWWCLQGDENSLLFLFSLQGRGDNGKHISLESR